MMLNLADQKGAEQGLSSVRMISSNDSEIKHFLRDPMRRHLSLDTRSLPYWLCIKQSIPIGLILLGVEPEHLLAPPDTKFFQIMAYSPIKPAAMRTLVQESKKVARQEKVGYMIIDLFANEGLAIQQVLKEGFEVFDNAYGMSLPLNKISEQFREDELMFEEPKASDRIKFVECVRKCLHGSPDPRIQANLKFLPMVPPEFWFNSFQRGRHFFVSRGKEIIGVLSFNSDQGLITNVAVAPIHRGKGYGRRMIAFALWKLLRTQRQTAYLRVHKDNIAALHLYEAFGFHKVSHWVTLLLRTTHIDYT
ncbi:MAG: GNAT family N-acetyltransferase [Candidatus Heimdallarchaeota archaeon]